MKYRSALNRYGFPLFFVYASIQQQFPAVDVFKLTTFRHRQRRQFPATLLMAVVESVLGRRLLLLFAIAANFSKFSNTPAAVAVVAAAVEAGEEEGDPVNVIVIGK